MASTPVPHSESPGINVGLKMLSCQPLSWFSSIVQGKCQYATRTYVTIAFF